MGAPGARWALAAAAAVAAASGAATPRVSVRDGRFVDEWGRDRHFRGVNVVYKDPPWLPHTTDFHSNLSFVQADIDLLASLGVNLIRLGVMWPGVIPKRRGEVDWDYIERARDLIHMAARSGIYTIVEPHQDQFNPKFCGEGAPDWWVDQFTTITDFPVPVRHVPFGTSPPTRAQCDLNISFRYSWTHDAARAFQTFWEKGAADFADYWTVVAQAFANEPSVIGGEIFNEPFMGDYFKDIRWRDNKVADLLNMQPFYQEVTRIVRQSVPRSTFALAFEPTWPVGTEDMRPTDLLTATSGFTSLPEADSIYAFHYYVGPCTRNLSAYLDERLEDVKRLGATPYASEFNLGAWDDESQRAMTSTFQEFESRLISYTGWQYKSYSGSLPGGTCTGCGNSFFDPDGQLNTRMAHSMGRPFVGAVAGHTASSRFDDSSASLTLEYTVTTSSAPTEVVVPGYWLTGGLQVTVHGDTAARVDQRSHPGKSIVPGVQAQPWWTATVHHSPGAARQGQQVRVVVSSVAFA